MRRHRRPRSNGSRFFYVELISKDALRGYMEYKRFTVQSLADRIGVSKATIGHLRGGGRKTVGPQIARDIEEALGVPPGILFVPKVVTGHSNNDPGLARSR